jgi:hypothetical protein
LAAGDERYGVFEPRPAVDAARGDRLESADSDRSTGLERLIVSPVFMPVFFF